MHKDNAIGMFMGLFIGDALGAPLEFTERNTGNPLKDMVGGGVHETAPGEWTDDGAMAMCIATCHTNALHPASLHRTSSNGATVAPLVLVTIALTLATLRLKPCLLRLTSVPMVAHAHS